jgi:hypothetical protein
MKEYELITKLDEIEELLNEVIDKASDLADETQGVFSGQLESYFIGWMKKFMDDKYQPGSIASLRGLIEQICEE